MRMFARFGKFAVLVFLGLVFSTSAFAQFRSAIEGTVTDPSGAVVPDAKVTLTNVDTGISQSVQSNAEGLFRLPSLGPGRYKLTATKQGFATTTEENITLAAEEIRTFSLALKAGTATETVTITAEVNPVQLSEAKVAGDISAQEITQLPLAGRNIGNLISFTPGVTGTANASRNANDTDIFSLVNNPQVNANGQRGEANMFYLDNTLATSNPDPGVYNLTPNPESIQELHVTVNDYSAEYGRGSSLIIQAVTKSGTNNFHGSLFEVHQDNKLTAANFADAGSVHVFRRNEFGGSIGGPFLKNKWFGFFSWDQKRASRPDTLTYRLETQDFVNFMKSNLPNNISTLLLTKFPATLGTVIAGSVQTVQNLDPNNCSGAQTTDAGIPCSLDVRQRTHLPVAVRDNGLQWSTRIDFTPSSKDRFYGNYYRKTPDTLSPNPRPAFNQLNNFAGITNYANLDWTRTLSPSLVNDAAMGVTRISGLGSCSNCQVPGIFGTGLANFGDGFSPAEFIQNDFQWRDLLSYNHGKHAMKFGLDIFRDQENDLFDGPTQRPGYIFFRTNVAGIINFANDNVQQEPGINFDLRTGALSQQSIGFRSTNFSFFGQDDYKLKPNLSINYGLRWDFNTSPNEQTGRTSSVILGSGSTLEQKIANASVGIVKSLMPNHSIAYFAPRLSFAWDPTKQGKLSIRGGVGVFYERPPNIFWSDAVRSNPPFIASVTADSRKTPCTGPGIPAGCSPTPVYGLCPNNHTPFNCPIPPPSQLPTGFNARGGSIACCSDIGGVDPATKQAYTISRFGGVQYSFTPNWMVEANYIGSLSIHQYVRTDRNLCDGCFDPVTGTSIRPNPFFNAIRYGDNSGWAKYNGFTASVLHRFSQSFVFQAAYTVGKTTSVVDAPGLGRDSLLSPVYDPYNINGQVGPASFDIPHAFTMHGLWELPKLKGQNAAMRGILGSWQLSGTTSLQGGYPFTVVDCNDSPAGNNGQCLLPDVTASARGTSCGKSGWLKGCLNANAFSLPASCQYVQVATSTNPNAANPNPFFLNCGSGPWEGNVGRNSFRAPGYADVDMGLSKFFHIPWFTHEGARLQVRGEFFNLFNRVNLNGVNSDVALAPNPNNSVLIPGGNGHTTTSMPTANSGFGQATGQAFFARTLQVGVRIDF